MTNNNPILALTTATHGLFRVDADHLNMTMVTRLRRTTDQLVREVHNLTGEEDYNDLTWIEAMILISYLTGGAAY